MKNSILVLLAIFCSSTMMHGALPTGSSVSKTEILGPCYASFSVHDSKENYVRGYVLDIKTNNSKDCLTAVRDLLGELETRYGAEYEVTFQMSYN